MNWLTSPLAATAVVFAVLAMLAVPLRQLTTNRAVLQVQTAQIGVHDGPADDHVSGVLRVRLLKPAVSVAVVTTGGVTLWRADGLGAGEHEMRVRFFLDDGAIELFIEADFGDADGDTAVFLSVLPDGLQGITHYAIGSGRLDDLMIFEWNLN